MHDIQSLRVAKSCRWLPFEFWVCEAVSLVFKLQRPLKLRKTFTIEEHRTQAVLRRILSKVSTNKVFRKRSRAFEISWPLQKPVSVRKHALLFSLGKKFERRKDYNFLIRESYLVRGAKSKKLLFAPLSSTYCPTQKLGKSLVSNATHREH